MLVVRSLVFKIAFYVVLIAIMILMLPTPLLGPDWVKGGARLWGRSSLWLMRVICGTRVEFRGRDNIPSGGIIVAAKHQSTWEVFALITVFTDFTYVLKRELTLIPLFGWYLTRAQMIAINRSKGRAALAQIARQGKVVIHDEGHQLILFPEGTRRPPGAPPQYKYGVAYVYESLGVPCVPVALASGLFWPRRGFIRRPGTIVVDILPPIMPGMTATEFLPELEARIEGATDRLIAEAIAHDASLASALKRSRPEAVVAG